MKLDKAFTPVSVDGGDELFPNGIFEFNVTKMLAFIEAHAGKFPIEDVDVEPLRGYSPLTRPVSYITLDGVIVGANDQKSKVEASGRVPSQAGS